MADPHLDAAAERLLPDATRRLIRTADGLDGRRLRARRAGCRAGPAPTCSPTSRSTPRASPARSAGSSTASRVPMYASQEARDADIAELAGGEPARDPDPAAGRAAPTWPTRSTPCPTTSGTPAIDRVPGGRDVHRRRPCPSMRLREVEIHHADLDAGYGPEQWPPEFAILTLDRMLVRGDATTPFVARAVDLDRTWTFGDGGPDRQRHRSRPGVVAHRSRRRRRTDQRAAATCRRSEHGDVLHRTR